MQISIFGHETIITGDVKKYVESKLGKFTNFRKDILGVEVTLEENHHQKIKRKAFLAKSLVKIPGYDIKAQAEGQTIYAAVEELGKKLERQLKEDKEKKTINKARLARSKNLLRKFLRQ